jgi:hypothetical protein
MGITGGIGKLLEMLLGRRGAPPRITALPAQIPPTEDQSRKQWMPPPAVEDLRRRAPDPP